MFSLFIFPQLKVLADQFKYKVSQILSTKLWFKDWKEKKIDLVLLEFWCFLIPWTTLILDFFVCYRIVSHNKVTVNLNLDSVCKYLHWIFVDFDISDKKLIWVLQIQDMLCSIAGPDLPRERPQMTSDFRVGRRA